MDFDSILPDIGEYGKYQKMLIWFVFLPSMIPCGFHAYNQLFMAIPPRYHCRNPALEGRNLSEEVILNISTPFTANAEGQWEYNRCLMFNQTMESLSDDNARTVIQKCQYGYTYYFDDPEVTSVVSEWDLVCDKKFFPSLALVLFGVSGFVGNLLCGYLQDGIGRQPSFFIYLLLENAFGLATAFATDFYSWLAFRIGVGFTIPSIMSSPFVLGIELVGPEWRTHFALIANVAYSLCLVVLGGIIWLVRDWRQMAIATSAPFFAFFVYWWVMPESPHWLLSKNRYAEAEKLIRKMAHVNGKILPEDYFARLTAAQEKLKDDQGSETFYGISDLFRTPNMARKTTIITFIWFTITSVYVGLSYYAPALGGNEYLNFLLAGVAELPTYAFLWPTMNRWGRRWVLCISMIIGGVACLATLFAGGDYITTLILYCTGKFGISSAFVVLPLMASEMYPTVVRGIGLSFSSMAGMIGPIYIPVVNYFGSGQSLTLPLAIMGSLMIAGAVGALMLPETLGRNLPQTLQEGESFGKGFGFGHMFQCGSPHEDDEADPEEKDQFINHVPEVKNNPTGSVQAQQAATQELV